ncbi:MAG: 50S ribosomal protein L24 [uncultured bacterium]|nr:MAG: 50S ribosomal protein L24 [uncultured bacterium]OGH13760.1 MAG: 50S ribosomal protein L24 [Candidatus Levybacteria bacterium RIFCSPHIGHO2_01_FULL_38_26]
MKLIKGDLVKIVRGKDQGKTGKIDKVFSKTDKVIVEGVNQYKRHLKARSQRQPSEIVTVTIPIFVSNAALICPKCKLATRVGLAYDEGKKVRICKKCKQKI